MALPLDKLGTTDGPTTTVIDGERARADADHGAAVHAFGATSQGAVVVEHGLAEVV
jgi:hypothetical protein